MENIVRRTSTQPKERRESTGTASESSRPPRTRPRGNSLAWMMKKLIPKKNNAQNDSATKSETEAQKEISELNDFAECSSNNSGTTENDCLELARKLSSAAVLSQLGGYNQPTTDSVLTRRKQNRNRSKEKKQKRKRLFKFKHQGGQTSAKDLDEMRPVKNDNSQEEVDELVELDKDLSSSYNRRAFLSTYTDVSNDRSELQECYKRGLLRRPKATDTLMPETSHGALDNKNVKKCVDVTRIQCIDNEI